MLVQDMLRRVQEAANAAVVEAEGAIEQALGRVTYVLQSRVISFLADGHVI